MVTADVRTTERLDGLVVTPREPSERHALSRALKDALPGTRLRLRAGGIWLAAHEADSLLDTEEALDLRWTYDARAFAENRRRAKQAHGRVVAEVRRLLAGGRGAAEERLHGVASLEVLDDHQWVNVAAMTLPDSYGLCLFDEQGAGKTVSLIFAFDVLSERDQVDFALIVAPKSMVPEWARDFRRFRSDLYAVEVVVGQRRQKRRALGSGADVLVTNFETAVSMEDELRAILRRHRGRAVLVVDESFFIKNLDAKRTRALRRLREWCGRAFVLCGTPAPNAPQDLVQQFNIVDFGLTFAAVAVPDDREAARPVVQRAIEERGTYVRHLKSTVLPDLPAKRFHRVLVPLQPEQARLYEAALRGLMLDLRATDDATFRRCLSSFLARRIALLQICSNPVAVADGYEELPAKLLALDDLLEGLIVGQGEKVVLWSFYTASLEAVVHRYSHFNAVRYDGTVVDVADRREAVRRFQEDDVTMLFVANPAAAGAGLTLHRARFAVYESMSNQAAHYLQSLDRVHRRGQEQQVEYVVLLCEGTVELTEYERLLRKERAAQALLGDPVAEQVTREGMISETVAALRLLGREA